VMASADSALASTHGQPRHGSFINRLWTPHLFDPLA